MRRSSRSGSAQEVHRDDREHRVVDGALDEREPLEGPEAARGRYRVTHRQPQGGDREHGHERHEHQAEDAHLLVPAPRRRRLCVHGIDGPAELLGHVAEVPVRETRPDAGDQQVDGAPYAVGVEVPVAGRRAAVRHGGEPTAVTPAAGRGRGRRLPACAAGPSCATRWEAAGAGSAARRRPWSRTPPARSTRPAGEISVPAHPVRVPSTSVSTTAAPDEAAADEHPGDRAGIGQPPPPDAEHQQRAERRRGEGERQPDRPRDADPLGRTASDERVRRPRRRPRPGTPARPGSAGPSRPG